MREETHSKVLSCVCKMFDVNLMQNNLRGLYVEHLVAELLGEGWNLKSGDWAAWDIEHDDGTRIEVKQSASKQSWVRPSGGASRPTFSIRTPRYNWNGAIRTETDRRQAHIYVFAWHGESGNDADHRRSDQWTFYVVPERCLPKQSTISLNPLRKLAVPVKASELRRRVKEVQNGGNFQ